MSRPKKGEGGGPQPIYVYEREREILRLLKERGDGRSISQVFCDCLKTVHGNLLEDTAIVVDKGTIEKYVVRARSMVLRDKEYKKQQMSWIEAHMPELLRIYPRKSLNQMYEELEHEVRISKEMEQ